MKSEFFFDYEEAVRYRNIKKAVWGEARMFQLQTIEEIDTEEPPETFSSSCEIFIVVYGG